MGEVIMSGAGSSFEQVKLLTNLSEDGESVSSSTGDSNSSFEEFNLNGLFDNSSVNMPHSLTENSASSQPSIPEGLQGSAELDQFLDEMVQIKIEKDDEENSCQTSVHEFPIFNCKKEESDNESDSNELVDSWIKDAPPSSSNICSGSSSAKFRSGPSSSGGPEKNFSSKEPVFQISSLPGCSRGKEQNNFMSECLRRERSTSGTWSDEDSISEFREAPTHNPDRCTDLQHLPEALRDHLYPVPRSCAKCLLTYEWQRYKKLHEEQSDEEKSLTFLPSDSSSSIPGKLKFTATSDIEVEGISSDSSDYISELPTPNLTSQKSQNSKNSQAKLKAKWVEEILVEDLEPDKAPRSTRRKRKKRIRGGGIERPRPSVESSEGTFTSSGRRKVKRPKRFLESEFDEFDKDEDRPRKEIETDGSSSDFISRRNDLEKRKTQSTRLTWSRYKKNKKGKRNRDRTKFDRGELSDDAAKLEHNALERNRRIELRERFIELGRALNHDFDKWDKVPTKVTILQNAKTMIHELEEERTKLRRQIEVQEKWQVTLRKKLKAIAGKDTLLIDLD